MAQHSINGQSYFADAPPDTPLLWVLREDLRLTGTRFGCGKGLCGSCTVHINGQSVRSCQVQIKDVAADAQITTIEGLSPTHTHAVQQASVRLLPIGPNHASRRFPGAQPEPDRKRNR